MDAPNTIEKWIDSIRQENGKVTHEEFRAGVSRGTIGIRCLRGEPNEMLSDGYRLAFSIFVLAYTAGPLVMIPTWALIEKKWWMLIAFPVSFIASERAAFFRRRFGGIAFILLSITIVSWWRVGITHWMTFLEFWATFGFISYHIADECQTAWALNELAANSELFERTKAIPIIEIIQRDSVTE